MRQCVAAAAAASGHDPAPDAAIVTEAFDGAVYGRKDVGPGAAEFLFLRKMDAVEKERAAIDAPEAAAPTCDLVSLANFVRQQVRRLRKPQSPPMMMFILMYILFLICPSAPDEVTASLRG